MVNNLLRAAIRPASKRVGPRLQKIDATLLSEKKSSWLLHGMPNRKLSGFRPTFGANPGGAGREYGSAASNPPIVIDTSIKSPTVKSNQRDAIDRSARWGQTFHAKKAACRLVAHNITKRGWDAAGPCRIGRDCKADQTRRNHNRRPRARAPGNHRRIERITRRSVSLANANQSGGELIEVGLADEDSAGLHETIHYSRRLSGNK